MKKNAALLIACLFAFFASNAQYRMRPMRGPYRTYHQKQNNLPAFKPSLSVSVGYGFPNMDKDQLLEFYNLYQSNTNQKGPLYGSLDYQFSPKASVGVMATYGKVSTSYYDYNNPGIPSLHGSLKNWSAMLNFVRYMPVNKNVSTYVRTAVGVNFWNQNYVDETGNKVIFPEPDMLAYQASLGAKFQLSKNSGIFIEAGYGKYILNGGLFVKL